MSVIAPSVHDLVTRRGKWNRQTVTTSSAGDVTQRSRLSSSQGSSTAGFLTEIPDSVFIDYTYLRNRQTLATLRGVPFRNFKHSHCAEISQVCACRTYERSKLLSCSDTKEWSQKCLRGRWLRPCIANREGARSKSRTVL
jgi:hypothetical protein